MDRKFNPGSGPEWVGAGDVNGDGLFAQGDLPGALSGSRI